MKVTEKQIELIDKQVKRLIASGSYYGEVYKKAGITGVTCQEDFEKLPFSGKDDLRNAYPLGIMACDESEIVRIHSSSGTTGKPVIIPYTAKDVDDWAIMFARCYETAGVTNKDRISGQQVSVSRQDAKSLVQWQFRSDLVTQKSSSR